MKLHQIHRVVALYWVLAVVATLLLINGQWHAWNSRDLLPMSLLFIVAAIQEFFPVLIRNSMVVTLTSVIYFLIFASFGLLPEILISQCILLFSSLFFYRVRNLERLVANSVMFILSSDAGAYTFRLLGGKIGEFHIEHLKAYIGFFVAYFIINHLILFSLLIMRRDFKLFQHIRCVFLDAMTSLLSMVLSCVAFSLYKGESNTNLYLIMIPLLGISYIFRLYHELSLANEQLSTLSKIGMKLTSELEMERTLDLVLEEVSKLVAYSICTVLFFNPKIQMLEPMAIKAYSTDYELGLWDMKIPLGFGPIGYAALTEEPVWVNRSGKSSPWADYYHPYLHEMESIISIPILWESEMIGVLMLGNFDRNSFTKSHLSLLTILSNQAAVAIQNAKKFQSSERRAQLDELTGLINYRHFDSLLHNEFQNAQSFGQPLTLVVMDIDHFKQVNDTYGHLAGNEVLKLLARRIQDLVHTYYGNEALVARYGGEEFTLLLLGATNEEGLMLAEAIRKLVEQTRIVVPTLNGQHQTIGVTISIGLATYPNQADSAMTLLRHADRAMYFGSKQAGRNRVASYQHI